ncbi:hypothetical protein PR048_031263 [Dryococelus australis]|uniref:FZ domain-containing protein n=1 Tax=Dryococelus australis TaxID=614101 RepID=A0ABQ9G7I4_9NEOP|nr:hypothetical protein PR048_031263 [Dryococelus australis]
MRVKQDEYGTPPAGKGGGGEREIPEKTRPTSGIVRHEYHSDGSDPAGDRAYSPWWEITGGVPGAARTNRTTVSVNTDTNTADIDVLENIGSSLLHHLQCQSICAALEGLRQELQHCSTNSKPISCRQYKPTSAVFNCENSFNYCRRANVMDVLHRYRRIAWGGEIPEETRRIKAASGTIPTCDTAMDRTRSTPRFPEGSHKGIGQDDAAGRRIFSVIPRLPRPIFIPAMLHTHLTSHSAALETLITLFTGCEKQALHNYSRNKICRGSNTRAFNPLRPSVHDRLWQSGKYHASSSRSKTRIMETSAVSSGSRMSRRGANTSSFLKGDFHVSPSTVRESVEKFSLTPPMLPNVDILDLPRTDSLHRSEYRLILTTKTSLSKHGLTLWPTAPRTSAFFCLSLTLTLSPHPSSSVLGGLGGVERGSRFYTLSVTRSLRGAAVAERSDFNTRPGFSQVGIVPDDAAGRRVFSGDLRFPPPLHSGADTFSPRFTFVGSQELVVKSRPNLSTIDSLDTTKK